MKYAALVCLALFAQAGVAAPDRNTQSILDDAHMVITKDLKEPGSVQFRNEYLIQTTGDDGKPRNLVCGEINAKSSDGAYAGFTRYLVLDQAAQLQSESNEKMMALLCDKSKKNRKVIEFK